MFLDEYQERVSTASVQEGIQRFLQTASQFIRFADVDSSYDHLLYVRNGVLDSRTLVVYPPEQIGLNFRFAWDFAYTTQSTYKTQYWNHFLRRAFSDPDDVVRLKEFICCLITGRKPKAAFFFFGPSNSGKSVAAEFVQSLLMPSTACTAVGFEKFNDSFFLEELSRGRLNVVTELSQECFRTSVVENFKKIVARESMTVSKKYHDPEEVRFKTTLLSCSNKPPKISPGDLDAVLNRMEVLIFPQAIPKEQQILNLKELLYSERDMIVSDALQQVLRLDKNNYRLTPTISSVNFIQQLTIDSPQYLMRDFFNDCMFPQENAVTPTADVIKAFRVYVVINGIGVNYSNKEIVHYFMAANPVPKKKHRVDSCKSSIQCFVGFSLCASIVEALLVAGEKLFGEYYIGYQGIDHVKARPAFHFLDKKVFQEISKAGEVKKPFTFVDRIQSEENVIEDVAGDKEAQR